MVVATGLRLAEISAGEQLRMGPWLQQWWQWWYSDTWHAVAVLHGTSAIQSHHHHDPLTMIHDAMDAHDDRHFSRARCRWAPDTTRDANASGRTHHDVMHHNLHAMQGGMLQ